MTETKPLAWDICCCAGGNTRGYQRVGFRVKGFDIADRPRYIGDEFVRIGAFWALRNLLEGRVSKEETPEIIAISPPCQKGNPLTIGTNKSRGWGKQAGKRQIIPALRRLLDATGLPYVIEQPQSEKNLIRQDLMLCGDMFRSGPPPYVQRHRYFEIHGFTAVQPKHRKHVGRVRGYRHGEWFDGPYVAAYGKGGGKATVPEMQHALGIDWTDEREELTEAILPAYGEHIARSFLIQTGRRDVIAKAYADSADRMVRGA